MTRSHSADEINADDTVSEDIDINEVFGRSSCDADSTLGSKVRHICYLYIFILQLELLLTNR